MPIIFVSVAVLVLNLHFLLDLLLLWLPIVVSFSLSLHRFTCVSFCSSWHDLLVSVLRVGFVLFVLGMVTTPCQFK